MRKSGMFPSDFFFISDIAAVTVVCVSQLQVQVALRVSKLLCLYEEQCKKKSLSDMVLWLIQRNA